jgi:hypothetical protein
MTALPSNERIAGIYGCCAIAPSLAATLPPILLLRQVMGDAQMMLSIAQVPPV